jgi:hypothetical protein
MELLIIARWAATRQRASATAGVDWQRELRLTLVSPDPSASVPTDIVSPD